MEFLEKMITDHELGNRFSPSEVPLSSDQVKLWVRFKRDPQRFSPSIFDGEWAITNQHPSEGKIRLLRVVSGNDGTSRVIGRQGKYLYAYPWFK